MSATEEALTAAPQGSAATSYRVAADALRRCLTLADVAADHGSTVRAAEYLLGALDDVESELNVLRSLLRPS